MTKREVASVHFVAAVRSPRKMLFHPRFWLSHLDYLALLTVAAFGGGTLLAQHLPEMLVKLQTDSPSTLLGNVFLGLIGGLSLWAIAAAALALAETTVDRSIAIVVEANADKKLEELQGRPGARVDFGVLSQVLPTNRSKPEPSMIRLAQELLKEARNLRFDARPHLIQRYRSDSAAHVFHLERLQKYALRLGILGTFVGLILALGSFSTLLSSQESTQEWFALQSQGVGAAHDPLFSAGSRSLVDSLRLAFGTSIAGLGVSLFIGAQAEIVRRRQLQCFRHMDDAALSLVTLASSTLKREDLLSSLEDNTGALKTLQAQVYDQSRKIEVALAGLDQRIGAQTGQIEEGLERLGQAREHLNGILTQVEESHRNFLRDLAAVYDRASLERMIGRIEDSIGTLGEDLAKELRSRATQVVVQFDGLLQQVASSHEGFLSDLRETFDAVALDKLVERIPESLTDLGEQLAVDLGEGIARVSAQFEALRSQVEAIKRGLSTAAQDLTEKTSKLQAAVQSIDSQVMAAAEESRRTMKEVPPALQAVRAKLDTVRSGSLVVFDAPLLKRLLLGSTAGLLLGTLAGNILIALAGIIVGPTLLLLLPRFGGVR